MSRSNEMLQILKRELGEMEESLLTDICDLCHWPHELGQEELDSKCDECTVYQDLESLLERQRTVAVGECMQIVAEEMLHRPQNPQEGSCNAPD